MSSNKRQKIQLRSDSKIKRSFDERVCDDLCEELLQFLPIEDKFRLECVSKQFQRTVFKKQNRLVISGGHSDTKNSDNLNIFKKKSNLVDYKKRHFEEEPEDEIIAIECRRLSVVLKKCTNVCEIVLGQKFSDVSIENIDEVLQTIADCCHRLQRLSLRCDSNDLNTSTIESFVERFGQQLRGIEFPDKYNILYRFCRSLVKSCHNLLSLSGIRFDHLFDTNAIIAKNVTKFENLSVDHSLQTSFDLFIRHFATKLKHLSIDFTSYQMSEESQLIHSLSALKCLKTLKVSSRLYSSNDSSEHLVSCLQSIAENCLQLKRFELRLHSRNSLNEELFKGFINLKNLRQLSFSCFEGRVSRFALNSLKDCNQLTHLRLELEAISDKFFDNCQTFVPNLTHLELSNIVDIKDRHLTAISNLKRLKHLKIMRQFNRLLLTSNGINLLLGNCKQLLTFHITAGKSKLRVNYSEIETLLIYNPGNVQVIIE